MAKLTAAAEHLKRQSGRTAKFSLAFMTDDARAPNPVAIAKTLPAGAAVILRDYKMRERAALAKRLKEICMARRLFLLVGADAALARAIDADGLHLPGWAAAKEIDRSVGLLTCACHNAKDLSRAAAINADAAFLSPVFATESHPDAPTLGLKRFRKLAENASVPVFALGGVTAENAAQLAGANVAGFAAIGAFVEG